MRIIHYLLISTALSLPAAYGMDGEQENQNYVIRKTDVRLVQNAENSSQLQQQENTITLSEEPQPGEDSYDNLLGMLPDEMLTAIINKLNKNERLKLRLVNKFLNDIIRSFGNIHILRFTDKHSEMLNTQARYRYDELFPDTPLDVTSPEGYKNFKDIAIDLWSQIFTAFPTIDTLDLSDLRSVKMKNYVISLEILPQIKKFNVGEDHFYKDISVVVQHLPNLTHLAVFGCRKFTDQELESLSELTGLTRLMLTDLSGDMLTETGILALANLTNLTDLTLIRSDIPANWIDALSPLTNLERLDLWNSSDMVTNDNLPDLVRTFPNLTYLGLEECDLITNAGLQHLAELNYLKELNVSSDMEITEDGLNSLRMQLPNLKINVRSTY